MRKQSALMQPVKRKKASEFTEADVESAASQLAQLEELIAQQTPSRTIAAPPKVVRFDLNLEERAEMAGFSNQHGDECRFLEWIFNGAFGVLSEKRAEREGNQTAVLQTVRGVLEAMRPKSPLETMLLSQMVVTHHLQMQFAERAMTVGDSELAAKLIERYARLSDVATRQAETIQRIRGEVPNHKTSIENLTVEDGGQAQIGQLNVKR